MMRRATVVFPLAVPPAIPIRVKLREPARSCRFDDSP